MMLTMIHNDHNPDKGLTIYCENSNNHLSSITTENIGNAVYLDCSTLPGYTTTHLIFERYTLK